MSQQVALECLRIGTQWVTDRVQTLHQNREAVWNAVSQMPGTVKTTGGFYFLVKLPKGIQDMDAVRYLAKVWEVLVIPCTSCGVSGFLRVSYGNLPQEECSIASQRLKNGLAAILAGKL